MWASARVGSNPTPSVSVSELTGGDSDGVEPEVVAPPGANAGDGRGRRSRPQANPTPSVSVSELTGGDSDPSRLSEF